MGVPYSVPLRHLVALQISCLRVIPRSAENREVVRADFKGLGLMISKLLIGDFQSDRL